MSETIAIRPVDLLIDPENPRLSKPNVSQRDATRNLVAHHQRKVAVLARDILEHGMNPAELPIVMRERGDRKRYIVLEGNRRVAALRALENPEQLVGAVDDVVIKHLRGLSRQYQEDPIEDVTCVLVKDRDEARHWIELRHTGQNEGAGIVPWGAEEASRFRARSGHTELHIQALDFLENHGLTPQIRSKVPSTSFRRLLGTPEVRTKLGVSIDSGELQITGPEKAVGKALLHVAKDLARGDTKVADIYNREQRLAYANNLPKSITDGIAKTTTQTGKSKRQPAPAKKTRPAQPRDTLIPRECVLSVDDQRAGDIETELRKLHISKYANATAVLLRVFIELSVDSYIDTHGLSPHDSKLRAKMVAVLDHLRKNQKITDQQAKPVRRALQKGSFLAPSVDLMHDYVHNKHVFPAPTDLRAHWNSLQPFMMAIWSA